MLNYIFADPRAIQHCDGLPRPLRGLRQRRQHAQRPQIVPGWSAQDHAGRSPAQEDEGKDESLYGRLDCMSVVSISMQEKSKIGLVYVFANLIF